MAPRPSSSFLLLLLLSLCSLPNLCLGAQDFVFAIGTPANAESAGVLTGINPSLVQTSSTNAVPASDGASLMVANQIAAALSISPSQVSNIQFGDDGGLLSVDGTITGINTDPSGPLLQLQNLTVPLDNRGNVTVNVTNIKVNQKGGSDTTLIILAVVLPIVGLFVLALLAWWIYMQQKMKKERKVSGGGSGSAKFGAGGGAPGAAGGSAVIIMEERIEIERRP